MNSCYPGNSRVLSVLLGFQREIRAFVTSSDQCNLSSVSWWLYRSADRAQMTGQGSWPTDKQLNALAQRLHARLLRGGGRSKRTKLKLNVTQVRVLLRDLLLVASGLRPSCLVDCCALTTELATLLLDGLTDVKETHYQWLVAVQDCVRAVLLDGNIFFVNVNAFIQEKMTTGWYQQMYVDVSASLALPTRISNSSEAEASRLQTFAAWTVTACKDVLSSTSRVLELKRPSTLNATALAGILLCYPCVYDILVDGEDITDEWIKQENCLTMCPLFLLQTTAILPQLEMTLQEFSVPQHLLHSRFNDKKQEFDSPLLNLLQACCRLQLQRAINQSCLNSVKAEVRVGTRTLSRVAL